MSGGADESSKELTEKLKKAMRSPDWPTGVVQEVENSYGLQLPATLLQELDKNNNLPSRLTAIRQLTLTLNARDKIVKEEHVERLWLLMEDLLSSSTAEGPRHMALALLTSAAVSANSTKRFGPMRHIMFNFVRDNCNTHATAPLFDLLSGALNEGKSLELVEDLVGPFLNSWFPALLRSSKAEAAIILFVNLTKTNAAYLDEPELLGLVKHIVLHMNSTCNEREGVLCLQAIETVVAYCHLPSVMLQAVVASLARVVSSPSHTERAWKLMRAILGTYLGVSAVFTLFDLIKNEEVRDPHITRGCVFFLHSALWGAHTIPALEIPYHFALPVMLKASEHPNALVVYEVAFAMKLLLGKLGAEIYPQAWTTIFSIVTNIYKYAIALSDNVKAQAVLLVVNDTVDYMEQLRDQDQFCVLREAYYTFLTPFTLLRTEASTLHVLSFLSTCAVERRDEDDWLDKLEAVLHQYYTKDPRMNIRVQAAQWMIKSVEALGKRQGTEVIRQIILPAVRHYRQEELQLRSAVVDVLGHIVYHHNDPIMIDCLQLLLETVTGPFQLSYEEGEVMEFTPDSAVDVTKAIEWLILIFKRRMWDLPSTVAITSFRALLTFLENHYARPQLFLQLRDTRTKIFEMIFQIRANYRYEIGLPDVEDAQINYGQPELPGLDPNLMPKYTPYIIIDHKHGQTLANHARVVVPDTDSDSDSSTTASSEQAATASTNLSYANDSLGSLSTSNASAPGGRQSGGPRSPFSLNESTSSRLDVSSITSATELTAAAAGVASADASRSSSAEMPLGGSSKIVTPGGVPQGILSPTLKQEFNFATQQNSQARVSKNLKSAALAIEESSSRPESELNDGKLPAATSTPVNPAVVALESKSELQAGAAAKGVLSAAASHEGGPSAADQAVSSSSVESCLDALGKLNLRRGPDGELLLTGGDLPLLPETQDAWREAQKHATITYLSLTAAAATVIVAIKREKDWGILKIILEGIPKMLQNKALIVSRDSNDIDYFAVALTNLINERSLNLPASLYNTPERFLRPDFEIYVYLAMSCLSCYRRQLSLKWRNTVVNTLTAGMMSKCGGVCIAALTLCVLEMQQTMIKSLPSILHSLTKISATVLSSQPVLEFLSTLLHVPHIYSNFSSEQYMAVFAIVIPYTNPIKFNQYVVILAFHVLAMWFLKCKINNRRNFVNFITKNLKNVLGPEDVQPRRRSASLNDQTSAPDRTEIYVKLHEDMRMTLLDLMSRYAFASCTPMARRSEVGEALVGSGQQQTWLVGLKLFTITTSGCSQRPMTPDGLCENCLATCTSLIRVNDRSADAGRTESNAERNVSGTNTTRSTSADDVSQDLLSDYLASSTALDNKLATDPSSDTGIPQPETTSQNTSTADAANTAAAVAGDPTAADNSAAAAPTAATNSIKDSMPVNQSHSSSGGHSASTRPIGEGDSISSSQSQAGNDSLAGGSGQQAVQDNHLCTCWCVGYSEVYVRQPTGNMVWMMRLQNHQQILEEGKQLSMDDLAALYGPNITPRPHQLHDRQFSRSDLRRSFDDSLQAPAAAPAVLEGRKRYSGRRSSDGCTGLAADGRAAARNSSGSSGRPGSGSPEARLSGDGGSATAEGRKLAGLTGTIIGAASKTLSVDEEEEEDAVATAAEERAAAVQRSRSNPEIDSPLPAKQRTMTASSALTSSSSTAAAASSASPAALNRDVRHPLRSLSDQSSGASETAGPSGGATAGTTTTSAGAGAAAGAGATLSSPPMPSAVNKSASSSAVFTFSTGSGPAATAMPSATDSSSGGGATSSGGRQASGATTPTVPPSPSKLLLRISNRFNTNINKFFGNPSPSSPGGGGGGAAEAAPDNRRLRHSSALSASNNSSSQPNMFDFTTTSTSTTSSSGGGGQAGQRERGSQAEDGEVLAPIRRGRGHTISVMNPASRPPPPTQGTPLSPLASPPSSSPFAAPTPTQPRLQELFSRPWSRPQPGTTAYDPRASERRNKDPRGGVTPSNVLLQLLYAGNLEKSFERPLLIPMDQEDLKRSIDVLDYTPPLENHCIGVLYVAPGQTTEQEILSNRLGSTRYQRFLRGLGTVVSLKKASKGFFLPGLSDKGDDGDECYVWQDEIMQVSFHVATLMPNKPNDPRFSAKKRHIGNDFVTIVYNDSGQPYNRDTIKTQFNTVIVEIRPAEHETNTMHMILKPQIRDLLSTTSVVRLVSDGNLALYARQTALHSVIACRVQQHLLHPEPYAGNWLRRLRTMYRLRQRLLDRLSQMDDEETTDFTDMLDERHTSWK